MTGMFRQRSFIFTSRPVVRGSTRGSVTRAAPLDVPVLVQDVFRHLHLTARSGQRLIWKQERKKHQQDIPAGRVWKLFCARGKVGLTLRDSLLDDVIFLVLVPLAKRSYGS